MHIAAALEIAPALDARRCAHLHEALDAKAKHSPRSSRSAARICMDATPLTLGQEFSGYAAQVKSRIARHRAGAQASSIRWRRAAPPSAPASTPSRNSRRVSPSASPSSPACRSSARRTSSSTWPAHDAYVFAHGALNAAATALFKIANDIRLLGSGPRSGLGELDRCRRTSPAPRSCRARSIRRRAKR